MRTYSYGAKAPTQNADLVVKELERSHRYYNILVEIERQRRSVRDGIYTALLAARPVGDKTSVKLTEENKVTLKATDDLAWEAIRQARDRRGCAWGTGGCIEASVQQAVRTTKRGGQIAFRRWEGTGLIAVQLQQGLSTSDLLKNKDTRVRLVGLGKRRSLEIRVGSDGRKPIWATFPIAYHRDLPPEADIKWVRVTARKVATKLEYEAQFILKGEGAKRPPPSKGSIAVDIGWRKFQNDGFRVAKWRDDTGDTGELRFPEELLRRWTKTEDLRSIRAKNFNAALKALCEARRKQEGWPEWLLRETQYAHQWESQGRMAGLVVRWRTNRFEGDEAIFSAAEAWRKQDKHLYEWESHQRGNVLRSRREMYRLFACFLATYKKAVFEKMDLRNFAELPEDGEDESHEATASRPRRFKACLSELRGCAEDAVARAGGEWIEVPSQFTTQQCSVCEVVRPFDAAQKLVNACVCGAVWDQDDNACSNLLRAATLLPPSPDRSQTQGAVNVGVTPAETRRLRGLETRRAKRSKKVG